MDAVKERQNPQLKCILHDIYNLEDLGNHFEFTEN